MASLSGATIATTFKSLLKLAGNTDDLVAGAIGAAKQVMTGDGENTPIYLNTDRVGIGTAAPASALDIESTTDGNYAARIKQDHATGWGVVIDNKGTTTGDPILSLTSNNGSNQVFWADSDGNVGIGTDEPAATLQVLGKIRVNETVADGSGDKLLLASGGSGDGGSITFDNHAHTASVFITGGGSGGSPSYFNGGNVGIGTTEPGQELEVDDGAGDGNIYVTGGIYIGA